MQAPASAGDTVQSIARATKRPQRTVDAVRR
jgi:hypothetical protein